MQTRSFAWAARYDAARYVGLLNTCSDHLALPAARRALLFAAVRRVIAEHGGYVDRSYFAVVQVAASY